MKTSIRRNHAGVRCCHSRSACKGIIEKVESSKTSHPGPGKTNYLPHHPVISRDKETTKLRVVYDASAKMNGNPSLNDCLYSGPSLLPSIADVLMRFRFHKVALVADIEKAFLMVSISPSDRDALRFIWLDDIHKDNPKEVVYRFCRVVFGVTSSQFLLNATKKQHLQKYANGNPELVKALLNSLYVDDMTSGESTVERGFDLFVNSRKIMAEGGFNLRKWQSNSPQLRCLMQGFDKLSEHEVSHQVTKGSFREEDDTYAKTTIGMENAAYSQCEQKVLGVNWNYLEDCLILPLKPFVTIEKIYCWTDSTNALHWIIRTNKEWKTFVENRVKEIRSCVPPSSWNHCPGTENPADIASRGTHASKLSESPVWFRGPEWLQTREDMWPSHKNETEPPAECLQEIKSSTLTNLTAIEASAAAIIDCNKYSSLQRLLRVTAYVKRFVHNISRKERITGPLSTNEIQEAEILWIKEMQGHLQEDELEKQLGLFKDEKGIIRCRGRLGNSQASYDTKFPALLSRNHHVTSLIIRYCHERVMHNGLKETLTEVRSRYWIPKGRQTVKKELFGCNICRRFQGRSYPVPESPDLPEFRVRDVHAFSCVGVDFAGPLFIKSNVKDDSEMTKVYIALFTCATSRAVHLELVSSLDAPTFLLCLRRFTGRRGLPKLIVSDNAKTFQASEKTLVSLFELEDVQEHLSSKGIRWQFNLAKAPWWGGFFERLVKQVKSCLKKTLGRSKLSFDELTTILVEVEAVLNSRPLT